MEQERKIFGHPVALITLFFTEMWERFSYYGMRALLMLFMTTPLLGSNPGLGLGVAHASAIYGLYTASVYFLTLAGGWIADNLWGQRKAVFVGGCIIAAGHFSMAVPGNVSFFLGLILIAIGTGLLKPNVSTMVGELYPEGGARRDAGFSVFYMGINTGAFLGPIICGALGENWNWHAGFSAAGIGMVLGLIQYKAGAKLLGNAGLLDEDTSSTRFKNKNRNFYLIAGSAILLLVLFGYLVNQGIFQLSMEDIASGLGYGILILVLIYFIYLFIAGGHSGPEKKRLGVIFWLFILAAVFWSGFEQAGSSLNLFADQDTNRMVGGWEVPASWLQSVNPIFIIVLAPVFGWLWTWLAARNANPSAPLKFALRLIGLSAGFFVISWGAANSGPGNLASPAWLIVTYFFHTCGELCLSPVGLSSVTKLAPKSRVGQMMGIWFVAAALGNLFAGLLSGQLEELDSQALFSKVAMFIGAAGIIALLASPFVRKLMGDVK
ncbi:peptide MFS transporter [Anseongella ginsenosidimutans]|uniref:peptide MFS transporter n=1 Tax=Anseongella ginsenosidimutans TaxID=496056 RepID=UPI0011C7A3FF|nr:peptide MFS transporter [Anseongella ginsenosidimutans]QEC52986.1 peptide MFS transporter [Anseongella ginsenosidimutans]